MKIGSTYSKPFYPTSGCGHGGAFSMLVALMLVSVQVNMIQRKYPHIRMGSAVEDGNIMGALDQVFYTHANHRNCNQ
mgnify:CR=1 FL=1